MPFFVFRLSVGALVVFNNAMIGKQILRIIFVSEPILSILTPYGFLTELMPFGHANADWKTVDRKLFIPV
ncbi:hypothetical protein GCM10027299_56910 [Larkinella ripae]